MLLKEELEVHTQNKIGLPGTRRTQVRHKWQQLDLFDFFKHTAMPYFEMMTAFAIKPECDFFCKGTLLVGMWRRCGRCKYGWVELVSPLNNR